MSSAFLRPASLLLVAAGGAVGAAAREGLVLGMPSSALFPWAIVAANLTGAFFLGLLYASLATASTAGQTRARHLRLLLGTGFCGGFTTYSTLAMGFVAIAAASGAFRAVLYGMGTVVIGALASWIGIALGTHWDRLKRPGSARP